MDVVVPDIGDFADVPVIEVLVEVGQEVAAEDPLITLESDKATMEVPSPAAGVVTEIKVALGDKVSEGTPILTLEPKATGAVPTPSAPDTSPDRADVVVLGAGPGGYSAAFRAADLGLRPVLVERDEQLGGVCLNVGCIPSKALLHMARVVNEAAESAELGLGFGEPQIDVGRLRAWKDGVVGRLTGGLAGLARQRGVEVLHGTARFTGPNALDVDGTEVALSNCIIAACSSAALLPGFAEDPRVMDSTVALELDGVPERLLVIGGGIFGLELATVYHALGSQITVVELMDQLIPTADADLVRPLHKRIESRYEAIHLATSVQDVDASAF